jgi:hypothetical protein
MRVYTVSVAKEVECNEKARYLEYGCLDSRKRVDRNGCLERFFVSKTVISNFISKRVISKIYTQKRALIWGVGVGVGGGGG